jgi:hypothetical protein
MSESEAPPRIITPSASRAPVRSWVQASRTNSVASRASALLGIAIPAIVARMALMCCQDAGAEGGRQDGEPPG